MVSSRLGAHYRLIETKSLPLRIMIFYNIKRRIAKAPSVAGPGLLLAGQSGF